MIKQYFLCILCICYSAEAVLSGQVTQANPSLILGEKAHQLLQLQKITEHINRVHPLGDYILAVPSFIIITSQDVQQFLAGIPYTTDKIKNAKRKPRQKRVTSMLEHVRGLWNQFRQTTKDGRVTPAGSALLSEIRSHLQNAFKHDISYTNNKEIASFMQRSITNNRPLIVRTSTNEPLLDAHSLYPVKPQNINHAIGEVLKTYYYDEVIEQKLQHGSLPDDIYATIIIQSFIMTHDKYPLISITSCSYDVYSHNPHIITIQSIFGHGDALKNPHFNHDQYYVHDNMIYPIITLKERRLEPDFENTRIHEIINEKNIQQKATLNPKAVMAITRATQLVQESYQQPVCLSCIKYDHTLYVTDITVQDHNPGPAAQYIDPLYIKKAYKDDAVSISPITPMQSIVILKHKDEVLFAPDLRTFLHLWATKYKDNNIKIGIIQHTPSYKTKEKKLLALCNIPLIWSDDFEHVQTWVKEKKWPLIIDAQQQIMFPYKRKKGFSTLFQIIENGLKEHRFPNHISVLAPCVKPITQEEKNILKPEEFFSGATMEHLFDLVRHEPHAKAVQALRSLLYRLQKRIDLAKINAKELTIDQQKAIQHEKIKQLQDMFTYIECIAYQIYKVIPQKESDQDEHIKTERLFLVKILKNIVMQESNENIVGSISFNTCDCS